MVVESSSSGQRANAISIRDLSLDFPVGKKSPDAGPSADQRRESSGRRIGAALRNISLDVEFGTRLGLIGFNGAGKSTLLRVMAGMLQPAAGTILMSGHVSTLFTPNVGVNQELSGRENIKLLGALLGRREMIADRTDEIIGFCDLGPYIDMPMRTYSAGMKMRLGFAVATSVDPEILLIDEAVGAGDRKFQERARDRINDTMKRAQCLVIASHSISLLKLFCDHVVWLEEGAIREYGDADSVLANYQHALSENGT